VLETTISNAFRSPTRFCVEADFVSQYAAVRRSADILRTQSFNDLALLSLGLGDHYIEPSLASGEVTNMEIAI
jgi:hypothetical protein